MKFLDIYHKLWWNIAEEEGLGVTWEEGAPNPDWISVFGRGKMGRGGCIHQIPVASHSELYQQEGPPR